MKDAISLGDEKANRAAEPNTLDETELTRLLARQPLGEQAIKDQRGCLAASSIFLLGWYNLVEIKALPQIGKNFVASASVLTWIAFALSVYYFVRFLSAAIIDLRASKLDAEIRWERAIKMAPR